METKWLAQGKSHSLIVFFSGWAFDEKCVAHLDASGYDVLAVYNYTSLDLPQIDFEAYNTVTVIGWSFGVWAAGYAMSSISRRPDSCYAINGTLKPVDDNEGIPSAVFSATLAGLNERNLQKFLMRACGGASAYREMQPLMSERSCDECRDELSRLASYFNDFPLSNSSWDKALIASNDSIFPFENTTSHWGAKGVENDSAHLPFAKYCSWQELINEFNP